MTTAEAILWKHLRSNTLGFKFRRQHPCEKYILDFVCLSKKLVIEIDGMSHDEINYDYDVERQKFIERKGFKVLRFSEFDVRSRIDEIMEGIYFELTSTT